MNLTKKIKLTSPSDERSSDVVTLLWLDELFFQLVRKKTNENVLNCYSLNNLELKWKKYFNEDYLDFRYVEGRVIGIRNFKDKTYEIEIDTGNIKRVLLIDIDFKIGNYSIITPLINGKAKSICVDYNSKKELWRLNANFFSIHFIKNDKLLGFPRLKIPTIVDRSYFVLIDEKTGEPFWTFSEQFDKYSYQPSNPEAEWKSDEVEKTIGTFQDKLWLVLKSGKVIGLHLNTGEIAYIINLPDKVIGDLPEVFVQKNSFRPWGRHMFINQEEGILYAGYERWYCEIDLKKEKPFFQLREIDKNIPSIDAAMISEHMTSTHFYYGNNRAGVICALNRKTLKLDWQHQFYENNTGYFRVLKHINNRLCVIYGVYTKDTIIHYLCLFE